MRESRTRWSIDYWAGRDPATVFESGGLIDELKKRPAEPMLNAEMDHHLGGAGEEAAGNHATATAARRSSRANDHWKITPIHQLKPPSGFCLMGEREGDPFPPRHSA